MGAVYDCRYFHSHIGCLEDCINYVDVDVPVRFCLDETVNRQAS